MPRPHHEPPMRAAINSRRASVARSSRAGDSQPRTRQQAVGGKNVRRRKRPLHRNRRHAENGARGAISRRRAQQPAIEGQERHAKCGGARPHPMAAMRRPPSGEPGQGFPGREFGKQRGQRVRSERGAADRQPSCPGLDRRRIRATLRTPERNVGSDFGSRYLGGSRTAHRRLSGRLVTSGTSDEWEPRAAPPTRARPAARRKSRFRFVAASGFS